MAVNHFEKVKEVISFCFRLENPMLDSASEEYSDLGLAVSVEECLCEPQYTGLSCEECAPGYYRTNNGPYGGNCVPCQCHGHAASCDKQTGICIVSERTTFLLNSNILFLYKHENLTND